GLILGVLSGFDRLRFRGTYRGLAHPKGLFGFLCHRHVLLKDFADFAHDASQQVRTATEQLARQQQRPLRYLERPALSKEDLVRDILRQQPLTQGLVAILSCVEPCQSFEIHRCRADKKLHLRRAWRKCLHYYHYFLDPDWGLMHVRLQTWLPFSMHVVVNGRERLARQLSAAGIGYTQRDNCFTAVADLPRAQALADQQLQTDWPGLLQGWARRVNPAYDTLFPDGGWPYYWSVDQSEWASDVLFRAPADLAGLYPRLLRHGIEQLGSRDVLRFLGRKATAVHYGGFVGEVVSDLKERPEGVRVKHRVNSNAVKMYDKQGSVLRVETTLNNVSDLKVYRPKEGDEQGAKDWRPLRKGVADLHRRAEVSHKANERYLEALAVVAEPTPLATLVEPLCRPVRRPLRARALNPLSAGDAALLAAVQRGEFTLNGFRNRDLRQLLHGDRPGDAAAARRQAAQVTRQIRLLRAHGLVKKVTGTHRYLVTDKGRSTITAILAARQAETARLTEAA
ncbi:MAG: hypothetical protein ACJ8H8_01755, partial [Geminicoccaceae bacterium]